MLSRTSFVGHAIVIYGCFYRPTAKPLITAVIHLEPAARDDGRS